MNKAPARLNSLDVSQLPSYAFSHRSPMWWGTLGMMAISLLFGLGFLLVRAFEFAALNVRWDSNAYGSVVWTLMGFHTAHLLTDWGDSAVLEVLFFTGPLDGRRFVDVSENSFYWYFV